ncbi:MAG TPA: hypothetical protein VFI77_06035 [Gemmatimonadales bacterium]|nr:hypothetical protein [Gemmatimonadales bacterium]
MRVLHSATRVLTLAALAALAVGCSKDSNGPEDSPFDPAGTSSDLSAVNSSFDSPALLSFDAASDEISLTTGGAAALALQARPTAALATGGKASAMRYAGALAKALSRGPHPSLAVAAAAIPPDLLGTTFVYDVSVQHYAASDLTGAPANGVRFLLYAVNPVTGVPTEPLTEVGYVDVVTIQTSSSASVNIVVVSDNKTYLDYSAKITANSSTSGTIGVSGYVTNGQDRVNFDLDNHVTFGDNTMDLTLDYVLTVPTRGGFRIDLEADATTSDVTNNTTVNLDLTAQGQHGTVRITGSETNGTGTFQVKVNGALFATIDVTAGSQATVTGKDGQSLTADEQAALEDVFSMFGGGLAFFVGLGPIPAF